MQQLHVLLLKFLSQEIKIFGAGVWLILLVPCHDAWAHGLIQDPPSRNWFCGATTKPDQVINGSAEYPVCGKAFQAPGMSPDAGYNFMSVLTHTQGHAVVGDRSQVCGFQSETWKGGPTVWDQPIDWPTSSISAGPKTFIWNIAWGPHFSDTQEFKYWITRPDFQFQVGRPLSFSDFESAPFCALNYSDAQPLANPQVSADTLNARFKTQCSVPARTGRHVIYAEWGRNYYTFERFHSCMDVVFGDQQPPLEAVIRITPDLSSFEGGGSLSLDAGSSLGHPTRVEWSVDSVASGLYRIDHPTESNATLAIAEPSTEGRFTVTLTVRDGNRTASASRTLTHRPRFQALWQDLGPLWTSSSAVKVGDQVAIRTVSNQGIDAFVPSPPMMVKDPDRWPLDLADAVNRLQGTLAIGRLDGAGLWLPPVDVATSRMYAKVNTGLVSAFLEVTPSKESIMPSVPFITPTVLSGPWYNEAQIRLNPSQPLTRLAIEMVIHRTQGVTLKGLSNTGGQAIHQTARVRGKTIVYTFELQDGEHLSPGTEWVFLAQTNGSGKTHLTAKDTYRVTYTMAGVTRTLRGHFC